jgi:hypothetical protein
MEKRGNRTMRNMADRDDALGIAGPLQGKNWGELDGRAARELS